MEGSRDPRGVFKGRYVNNRPKHSGVRCTDPKSYMADEDSFEPMLRYSNSVKVARSESRARAQSGGVGEDTREGKD